MINPSTDEPRCSLSWILYNCGVARKTRAALRRRATCQTAQVRELRAVNGMITRTVIQCRALTGSCISQIADIVSGHILLLNSVECT